MSYLSKHGTRRVPQWLPLGTGQVANSAGGSRLGGRRLDAAGPLPGPRHRGRLVLRDRARADASRTPRRSSALHRGRRPARGRARSSRSSEIGPRAEERPGDLRAGAGRRRRRRGDPQGGARGAAAGLPHRHAPVPLRGSSWRASAAGAAALRRAVAAGTTASRPTSWPTRRSSTSQRDGWSHRDLLRLAHPARRRRRRQHAGGLLTGSSTRLVERVARRAAPRTCRRCARLGFERAQRRRRPTEAVGARSASTGCRARRVPTQFLTDAEVWEALLEEMPMTALIRNLATMTRVGLLAPRLRRHRAGCRAARRCGAAPRARASTRSRCWRR